MYGSEEEQIEALRRWWQKNGRSLLTGLAIVLLGVLGWQYWQSHQREQAEAASLVYSQMLESLDTRPEVAAEHARSLIAKYPSSIYGDYASLALARIAVESDRLDEAAAHLRRVTDNGSEQDMRDVARLRLGRVLLAQNKPDEALALVRGKEAGSFRAAFEELKGDIYVTQGKVAEARAAYGNALAGYDTPAKRQIVEMKLDDLAPQSEPAAPAGQEGAE